MGGGGGCVCLLWFCLEAAAAEPRGAMVDKLAGSQGTLLSTLGLRIRSSLLWSPYSEVRLSGDGADPPTQLLGCGSGSSSPVCSSGLAFRMVVGVLEGALLPAGKGLVKKREGARAGIVWSNGLASFFSLPTETLSRLPS